jgi:hypothetical protein
MQSFPHKRLSMDAAIKLRNAGYSVFDVSTIGTYWKPSKVYALSVFRNGAECGNLQIICGCVDNVRVEELLNANSS